MASQYIHHLPHPQSENGYHYSEQNANLSPLSKQQEEGPHYTLEDVSLPLALSLSWHDFFVISYCDLWLP